ncbi:hypothetical protein QYE76_005807 [Lolium multiflorum]|uniref:Ribonuclease H1 N-terminal domain-containing protein n=1 Tax=Lolium multiflorum TaxID=4521 RepID=A0AAD8RV75_LOLMU|nr:hypothetical protein QYE76_005807 [Lolium multiflorum]
MLPLQDSILVLESILLKDKDPNYPVFTVKVPRDVGFVTDAPADIFFIAYEDIFKLFHARRLDYNLVRLFALNLAMKIKRESTPDVAIADPYYMRESRLNLSAVRVGLRYLHKLLGQQEEGQHPLGLLSRPENSTRDAFYVMHHLKGFVRDSQNLRLPSALRGWAEKLARINDDDLREDFQDTRVKLSHIIIQDVTTGGGPLHQEMPTYVVYKGRVPGVYEEWQDCLEQVHKFSGNSYKGYATREEAVAQWRAHVGKKKNRLKFLVPLLLTATAVVLYFTLV